MLEAQGLVNTIWEVAEVRIQGLLHPGYHRWLPAWTLRSLMLLTLLTLLLTLLRLSMVLLALAVEARARPRAARLCMSFLLCHVFHPLVIGSHLFWLRNLNCLPFRRRGLHET